MPSGNFQFPKKVEKVPESGNFYTFQKSPLKIPVNFRGIQTENRKTHPLRFKLFDF